jgi:hypothetical protein
MTIAYANADPIPDKYLQPDGSISTLDGTPISPANAEGAQRWLQADPIVNKWLNPDGTISSMPLTGGTP